MSIRALLLLPFLVLASAGVGAQNDSNPGDESNTPPTVNAGIDVKVKDDLRVDQWTTVNGRARDPDEGQALVTIWKMVSGPEGGEAKFEPGDESKARAVVKFTVPGQYVLRLEASDGVDTVSDDVTLEVLTKEGAPHLEGFQQDAAAVVGYVDRLLESWSVPKDWRAPLLKLIGMILMLLVGLLADFVARRVIIRLVNRVVAKTQTRWDDIFMERGVLNKLSRLAPALVIYALTPVILDNMPQTVAFIQGAAEIYMLVVVALVLFSCLDAGLDIYQSYDVSRRMPIKSLVQVVKIIVTFIAGILALSVITGENPNFFLGGLGAMTAILMLIFKDSLLGFVAGIQLSTNNMIRRGDWIEMPQFGADGDVLDVSLTTVKVQNWDKTVSTIPTYALISQSFKNWRGMQESPGRRIKRAIYIDVNTIKFCDEEMLARFRKIQVLREYLDQKLPELAEYNESQGVTDDSLVNGRRLTNVGIFRVYLQAYLAQNPKINKDLTFLVRQLAPTDHGLPIEIYVFSGDKVWVNYEGIQADIFDHVLAVMPHFDLRVFQSPAGVDLRGLAGSADGREQ